MVTDLMRWQPKGITFGPSALADWEASCLTICLGSYWIETKWARAGEDRCPAGVVGES